MIRIHFSAADLGRVSFPPEPEPLWQVALAARVLGSSDPGGAYPGNSSLESTTARRWQRVARSRVRPTMRPLLKLFSPVGQFPGFLTPTVGAAGLDPAIDCLLETPAELIRAELEPHLPSDIHPYLRGLLAGRAEARRALAGAVREFHEHVLGPSAVVLGRSHAADLAYRSQTVLTAGTESLLTTLHPQVSWQAPTLAVASQTGANQAGANQAGANQAGANQAAASQAVIDLHLNGRGLRLQPSPFVSHCLVADEPDQQPTLIYPSLALPISDPAEEDPADPLADLLGRTRAAVIRTLAIPASTTQLARRLGISNASASEHTRVLRGAGLLITHRARGTAHHSLTPTAQQLLALGHRQGQDRARDGR